ncbi:MAG: MmcQ/YjbR family DNA-binding protein [Rikenellaceae bacterium]
MNVEEFRDYCLGKKDVEELFPFGHDVLVFKVCGKMFALAALYPFESIKLKCDPDMAIELRDQYSEIVAAFHMNKKHWNDVSVVGSLSDEFLMSQIDNSYDLILKKNKCVKKC